MKKSQDNLKQIENQLEEIEKLNFVERHKFQPGHMVGQLLKEEKEFGVLLDKTFTSPEVDVTQKLEIPSHDTMTSCHTVVKHCDARVQPRQSHSREQDEVANEDEMDVYGTASEQRRNTKTRRS